MSSFAKLTAILLPLSITHWASAAFAEERCSGTLCDLYYGKTSSFDDKPAQQAPTPMTVPRPTIMGMFSGTNAQQPAATSGTGSTGAAAPAQPAKRPMVGVGGGGLAALARGEAPERCSGSLCDLYYGKSSSFEDEKPPAAAAAPAAPQSETAEVAAEATPSAALRMEGFETRPEPPRCAAKGKDAWSCYR